MISNKLSHHYNCFIAVIVCIFLLSVDRSFVHYFIFLTPHSRFHFIYSHAIYILLAVHCDCQSHIHICTFIELYSTYSQPPGQTIVNKQNNERTSAVIMQKATTNAIKQLIWWCAVCMANVSESLCVSVSMPISRDDIHTDSNLIMQCIQRTPLLPVFQSLDEMYTHKHTLCSAEFHHRHKCVQTLHKYT